jgi:hypothetical protein
MSPEDDGNGRVGTDRVGVDVLGHDDVASWLARRQ